MPAQSNELAVLLNEARAPERVRSVFVEQGLVVDDRYQHSIKVKCDLNGVTLRNVQFEKLDLSAVDFSRASLEECVFRDCQGLSRFQYARLDGVRFESSSFNVAFEFLCGVSGEWFKSQLSYCAFRNVKCSADFRVAMLDNVRFEECLLRNAKFYGTTLVDVSFPGSQIRGCSFEKSKLHDCDFRTTTFDASTKFSYLQGVKKTQISRAALDSLVEEYGGLTGGDLRQMEVYDDVATLRQEFSGFWMWSHILGITLFLAPYVWFVTALWARAHYHPPGDGHPSVTIWRALLNYIVTGGETWKTIQPVNVWAVLIFVTVGLYNLNRVLLLRKTKKLEAQELTTRVAVNFSFSTHRLMHWSYWLNRTGLWGMIALALINTFIFMQARIGL